MKQSTPDGTTRKPGKTRVSTRDLVTIRQRWRRRRDNRIVTVVQVHRADREVEVLERIPFTEFRKRYELVSQPVTRSKVR